MKKVLILVVLALGLMIPSCGTKYPTNTTTTTAAGNWEAQFSGGVGPASQLTFVAEFSVTVATGSNAEPLQITGFSFINAGSCFATGITATSQTGNATLNATSTGIVTGSMVLNITSNSNPGSGISAGNVLALSADPSTGGGVTGTSSAGVGVVGNLSSGVVKGLWTLTSSGTPACNGSGTFLMCQAAATCTGP
jgi:hypothetical protein